MSIENNLERIANALEQIAANTSSASMIAPTATEVLSKQTELNKQHINSVVEQMQKTVESAPKKQPPPPPVDTQTQSVQATSEPTPPVPSPSLVVKDASECNDLLVAEFNRLGGHSKGAMDSILGKMNELYGVRSVDDLTAEQYAPLIEAVRTLS